MRFLSDLFSRYFVSKKQYDEISSGYLKLAAEYERSLETNKIFVDKAVRLGKVILASKFRLEDIETDKFYEVLMDRYQELSVENSCLVESLELSQKEVQELMNRIDKLNSENQVLTSRFATIAANIREELRRLTNPQMS